MPQFTNVSANIRITNENRRSVCSVNNVNPSVTAQVAFAFVDAIKTIYNNGSCTARLNVSREISDIDPD